MGLWASYGAWVRARADRAWAERALVERERAQRVQAVELVPLPGSPTLVVLFERYTFMHVNWSLLDEASRTQYERWVASSRTKGLARRRARRVSERVYYARSWTSSRCLRWLQSL